MTLPGRYYYDPEIFAQEQEHIFSRVWMCVGRADAIPAAGNYFLANVGYENVIVLRDRQGDLRPSSTSAAIGPRACAWKKKASSRAPCSAAIMPGPMASMANCLAHPI